MLIYIISFDSENKCIAPNEVWWLFEYREWAQMHLAVIGHDLSRGCYADEDIEKPAENGVANGDESAASKKKKKKEKAKAAVAVEAPKESEPEPEAEDEGEVKVLDPAEVSLFLVLLLTGSLVRFFKVLLSHQDSKCCGDLKLSADYGRRCCDCSCPANGHVVSRVKPMAVPDRFSWSLDQTSWKRVCDPGKNWLLPYSAHFPGIDAEANLITTC